MNEQLDKDPIIAECSTLIFKAVASDSKGPLRGSDPSFQVDGCEERRLALLNGNKAKFVNTKLGDFPPLEDESEGEDGVACAEPRMQKSSGFVPVGRQVFESPYFIRGKKDSVFMLLDLYGQAEFKDTTRFSFKYHKPVHLKRGQVYTALRYLGGRWGVSTNKVRTFLKNMQDEGLIETQHERSGTIITLLHYGGCNSAIKSTETQDETDSDTQSETQSKRSRNADETNPRRQNKGQEVMNNLKKEGTADV